MINILITSVGSLVGQNILDVLESRRNNVRIIGMNSIAENQRNFRCDTVYLAPPLSEKDAFNEEFGKIIESEKPDLILAGRDIDSVFLADYKIEHPDIGPAIPCGHPRLARMMLDKYESYVFAKNNSLPFAETMIYRNSTDKHNLEDFISRHGFPLVIKPREGFGSLRVYFITDMSMLNSFIEHENTVLLQECLSPDPELGKYYSEYKKGLPLFFQVPIRDHVASQSVISPAEEVLGIITTRHDMSGGKAESVYIFKNKEVDDLIKKYVETLAGEGWMGFINIQCRPDRNGVWKVYEMNPRMAGASSARLLLGFDELGMLIRSIRPELSFPDQSRPVRNDGFVLKYLTDYYVEDADVTKLTTNRSWNKDKT